MAAATSAAAAARRGLCMRVSRRAAERMPGLAGILPAIGRVAYWALGLKVNGSSLPHFSGAPCKRSFCERACDRWIASLTIRGVDDVGLPDAENVCGGVMVNASAAVAVVAVWADAGVAATARAPAIPAIISFNVCICFIVSSCISGSVTGIPSHSGIAFGQDFRRGEDHAVGTRVRGRRDRGLWRSGHPGQELDAHQQREVFVHRVVAMVDVGSAE